MHYKLVAWCQCAEQKLRTALFYYDAMELDKTICTGMISEHSRLWDRLTYIRLFFLIISKRLKKITVKDKFHTYTPTCSTFEDSWCPSQSPAAHYSYDAYEGDLVSIFKNDTFYETCTTNRLLWKLLHYTSFCNT